MTHIPPGLAQLAQEEGLTDEQVTRLRQLALRQGWRPDRLAVDEWRNLWDVMRLYAQERHDA